MGTGSEHAISHWNRCTCSEICTRITIVSLQFVAAHLSLWKGHRLFSFDSYLSFLYRDASMMLLAEHSEINRWTFKGRTSILWVL